MQNITAFVHAPAIFVESPRTSRFRAASRLLDDVQLDLVWLTVFINVLSAGAFTVAAGFASEFVLMTRFWFGALLGILVYGLMLIGVG
jgi:hypothetical protein